MRMLWLLVAGATMVIELGITSADDVAVKDLSWRESKCCGPNCLYAVAKLHGIELTLAQVHSLAPPGDTGISSERLEEASESLGLPMETIRVRQFNDLARFRFPVIAHLSSAREGHYLLFLGLNEAQTSVLVADVLTSEVDWKSAASIQSDWSGFLLVPKRDLFWNRAESAAKIALTLTTMYLVVAVTRFLYKTRT